MARTKQTAVKSTGVKALKKLVPLGKNTTSKRHAFEKKRRAMDPELLGLSNPAARRIAQRAGVLRQSSTITGALRAYLKKCVDRVLHASFIYMRHDKRHMVQDRDVVAAMHNQGLAVYGTITKTARHKAEPKE